MDKFNNKLITLAIIVWLAILVGFVWQLSTAYELPTLPSDNSNYEPIIGRI